MKTSRRNAFLDTELYIVFGLIAVVIAAFVWLMIAADKQSTSPEVFAAWHKANPASELNYAEWKTLYRAECLPGQGRSHTETVVMPMPVPTYR